MTAISARINELLQALPRRVALEWPSGKAGAQRADLRLVFNETRGLLPLLRGQIGLVADAYVRGKVDIHGSLGDVMAVAAALVGDPVRAGSGGRLPRRLAGWLAGGLAFALDAPARTRRLADRLSLRRVGRVFRALARPAPRLFLRLLRATSDDAGAGAGGQA